MKVKIGVDAASQKRFLKSFEKGGESFLNLLFTPQEIRQNSPLQLASIFCLKEAVIKALVLPKNSWLAISTNRKKSGKVECTFTDKKIANRIISLDTSITHDRGLIIAVAIAVIKS